MKQLCIAVSLFLFFVINSQAEKLPANGQIITATDTIDVVFTIPINTAKDIPDYEKMQEKMSCVNAENKKVTIKPSEAKELRFVFRSRTIRMISRKNNLMLGSVLTMEGDIFLKLEIDGPLKLFTYYNTRTSGGGTNYGGPAPVTTGGVRTSYHKSIYQKGEKALMMPDGITFRSDMKKYLSDSPQLVTKFENKELKKEDEDYIVNFYNKNCGK